MRFPLISRAHHEDVVNEKERIIVLLSDQIDWLRSQLGMPTTRAAINPSELPPLIEGESAYLSEEEEDIQHLLKTKQLTQAEAEAALASLLGNAEPYDA